MKPNLTIMETIKIMIVDDHQMFMDGITSLLEDYEEIQVVAEAIDGNDCLKQLELFNDLDVVVTDVNMPGLGGEELCKMIKSTHPHINILVLSMLSDGKSISKLLENGAAGYILKNTGKEELFEALRTVSQGETYFSEEVKNSIMKGMSRHAKNQDDPITIKLTKREIEIIKLIAAEYTTQEIADELFISLHTVESHRKNILRKTNVRNLAGLIRYALKIGIIE